VSVGLILSKAAMALAVALGLVVQMVLLPD
jgi:hypothetical protein